jgi:type I restriction enzyme S subunit
MLKRIKIGDLIKQKKAHSQTGPFGTQLKASDYVEEGIPVINVRNIGFGEIRESQLEYLDDDTAKILKSHRLLKNDIVFGRKGAVERHSLISVNEEGWIQGSDCIRLRFLNNEYNPTFISYFFRTEQHKQWMTNLGSFGATMGSLNQDIISKIEIPDLLLPVQNKIASILSTYDELIENNKQRIKLLEEMAEEIYKEWFLRLRFPGYETTKIVDGLPEGWEKVKVDDYIKFEKGIEPGSDNYSSEKIDDNYLPFLRVGDLGSRDNSIFVHKDLLKGKILSKEDIAITLDGSVGLVAMNLSGGYSSGVRKIVYKNRNLKRSFIYLTLLSENIQGTIKAHAAGTTILHAGSSINFMRILLPDEIILAKFEEIVNPMIEETLLLKEKNKLLQETRDLLLPRLLSGKLSVDHLVEKEVELAMVAEPKEEYK